MDCSTARELIPLYCRGELDGATRAELEQHISGCSECREELQTEQELGCIISKSAADDPPDEYWESYNAKVRSRVRATTGMLWRLGWLPGCLAGAFAGLIFTGVTLWLTIGRTVGSIQPTWLKGLVVTTIVTAVGVIIYLFGSSQMKKANRRMLPRYEQDEMSLKRAIAANPTYRKAAIALLVTGYVGMSVLAMLLLTGAWGLCTWRLPVWTMNLFRFLMLFAAVVGIPAQYLRIRDYVDGSRCLAEWAKTHRKYLLLSGALFMLSAAYMLAVSIWQFMIIAR